MDQESIDAKAASSIDFAEVYDLDLTDRRRGRAGGGLRRGLRPPAAGRIGEISADPPGSSTMPGRCDDDQIAVTGDFTDRHYPPRNCPGNGRSEEQLKRTSS